MSLLYFLKFRKITHKNPKTERVKAHCARCCTNTLEGMVHDLKSWENVNLSYIAVMFKQIPELVLANWYLQK